MLWPSWIVLLSQRGGVTWSVISLITLSDVDLGVHLSGFVVLTMGSCASVR